MAKVMLIVEGRHDAAWINRIICECNLGTSIVTPGKFESSAEDPHDFRIHNIEGKDQNERIRQLLGDQNTRVFGFVRDADSSVANCRKDVAMLAGLSFAANTSNTAGKSSDGFNERKVHRINRLHLGIWVMPDNERAGEIEDFLRSIIDENDCLFAKANAAVEALKHCPEPVQLEKQAKAVFSTIDTWLEFSPEHKPKGTAAKTTRLRLDSPEALGFMEWLRMLLRDANENDDFRDLNNEPNN